MNCTNEGFFRLGKDAFKFYLKPLRRGIIPPWCREFPGDKMNLNWCYFRFSVGL